MRISDWSSDVCSSDLQQVVEQVGRLVHHALPATARSFDHRLHRFLADLLGDLVEAAMEQARGVRAVGIGAAAALDHRVERIEHRAVGGILRHGEALPLDGAGCPATGRTATGRTGNPWAARQALAPPMAHVPKGRKERGAGKEVYKGWISG